MKKLSVYLFLFWGFFTFSVAQASDWRELEKIFGRKGTVQGDAIKFSFPRSDLHVSVGNITVEPGLALTSWAAFKTMDTIATMMGDLVLLETEIAPVTSKLVESGVELTGLHNHIVGESPRLMYLHFAGHGAPTELAQKLKNALMLTTTPRVSIEPYETSSKTDWTKVESIFGRTGTARGDLLNLGIPRAEKIIENDMEIPPLMGTATAINFQTVGQKAATTGDFVLVASEVNPVIKALIEHNIAVTAIHSHMLFESPRLFFLHFWGFDDPEKLARGLRSALDHVHSARLN